MCTCWNAATSTQLPACYSHLQYNCPGGVLLQPGPEPSGACSVTRTSTEEYHAAPGLDLGAAALQPTHAALTVPPQTAVGGTAVGQDPAVGLPSSQSALPHQAGPLPAADTSSSAGPPPTAGPQQSGPLSAAGPQQPGPQQTDLSQPAGKDPDPSNVMCGVPAASLGIQVAPVLGTLTPDGRPATDSVSVPPFARVDNTKTSRLIRMPVGPQEDPHGLLSRPVPTSAWCVRVHQLLPAQPLLALGGRGVQGLAW